MKKIILIILLLIPLQIINARVDYNGFIMGLENKNLIILNEINKIESYLIKKEKQDNDFYLNSINRLDKNKEYLKNEIIILNTLYNCEELNWKCNSKIVFYGNFNFNTPYSNEKMDKKIIILNEVNIRNEKIRLLEQKLSQNKDLLTKIKDQEHLEKELEKQKENSLLYLEIANKFYAKENYRKAIENYGRSCRYYEVYNCYYGLGLANFQNVKISYKRIDSYGYKRLYEKSIEGVNANIKKAIELSENKEQRTKVNNLLLEFNNYLDEINKVSNKEIVDKESSKKIVDKEQKKVKVIQNKKGELIYEKLQNITSKYSEQKKIIIYKNILTKIEKLKSKKTNKEILNILEYLKIKLENYLINNK